MPERTQETPAARRDAPEALVPALEEARVLRVALRTFIAVTWLAAALALYLRSTSHVVVGGLAGGVYALLLLGLDRFGPRLIGRLTLAWFFIAACGAIAAGYGVADVAMMLFPTGILLGALLLPRYQVVSLVAVSVVAVTVIGGLKIAGVLPTPPLTYPGAHLFIAALFLIVSGIVIEFATSSLRTAVAQARRNESNYREILDATQEAILLLDADTGRILEVNRTMLGMFQVSREDALGRSLGDFSEAIPGGRERAAEWIQRAIAEGPQIFEWRCKSNSGRLFWSEITLHSSEIGGEGRVLAAVRDVDERRLLQQRLRQAQQLESMGLLAGGVAHDFNNILTGIFGFVDMALARLPEAAPAAAELHEIRGAASRASELTRQLLAFGQRQVLQARPMSLNELVERLRRLLERLVRENVRLLTDLGSDIGSVRCDPGQIEQVLLNLVVNARDAMPNGGTIYIETRTVPLEEQDPLQSGLVPGRYARLSVTDTGHGMDAATQSRAFEPFFTTKRVGEGTGLGLSTVYGIVAQSGGSISVESAPGRGTTFRVYLPLTPEEPEGVAPDAAPTLPPSGGAETILVAEDDHMVRSFAERTLRGEGYQLLVARDGVEALDIAGGHPQKIHLVLTDVVMPILGGFDLAQRIRTLRPDTRVLFMSGHSGTSLGPGRSPDGAQLLAKPFDRDQLLGKVREVLDVS